MIKELKGINEEKRIKPYHEEGIDNLFKLEKSLKELPDIKLDLISVIFAPINYYIKEASSEFFDKAVLALSSPLLDKLAYDESDLKSFIHIKSGEQEHSESLVNGLITSCFLDHLTRKNRSNGKRTSLHIDGKGAIFSYLFFQCRNIDELVIENFKGYHIASEIACHKGKADLVVLKGIDGDLTARGLAHSGGNINMIAMVDCNGSMKMELNWGGIENIGVILDINNSGQDTRSIGPNNGNVGLYLLEDNKHDVLGTYSFGKVIDLIIIKNSTKSNKIIITPKDGMSNIFYKNEFANKLILMHPPVHLVNNSNEDGGLQKRYRIKEFISQIESLSKKDIDETIKIVRSVYDLYNIVKREDALHG